MAVSPDGDHLYVATRLSNTVNAYDIAANGTLSPIAGQPFATGGTNGKGLAITPDGEYLYVSNEISDNITRFAVLGNGQLSNLGTTPLPAPLPDGADADLESIVITPNQGPTASFAVTAGFAGQPTGFDGTGSVDTDGDVAQYSWDFGDGTTLPDGGPIPNHIYDSPGTFTATLTVIDDEDCSDDRIFTGKAMLCNASDAATTTRQVNVTAAPPGPAPSNFARTLTIKYKKNKKLFKGQVGSDGAECIDGEKVTVFRKKKGADPTVGSAVSAADGKWQLKQKDAKGKFYARVNQTVLPDDDTCLAVQSKKTKKIKQKKPR
jgi:PKD repeat protein